MKYSDSGLIVCGYTSGQLLGENTSQTLFKCKNPMTNITLIMILKTTLHSTVEEVIMNEVKQNLAIREVLKITNDSGNSNNLSVKL